jgi:predicted membrane channel-forming protein YqfA (hemolysin III family)
MLHNTMNEPRIKHLEMIQVVINRLAGNSFMLKSWSITVVSALMALAAKDANARYALLALFPALCFSAALSMRNLSRCSPSIRPLWLAPSMVGQRCSFLGPLLGSMDLSWLWS